ncbi:MAG: hydrolase TatD [Candidatus Melainabacteria bacterium RIFOXYA12_FULL_32_12]|nr:MAG: hydrolase TatD [Candidatus Melainabacteria bacterium RIFOXYA2_FULL_32_9]OGI29432.1 MAG: hydrolase TatD [Candidatus Melainabacteria bacterium RIFOXYA12_FULL_32_12]
MTNNYKLIDTHAHMDFDVYQDNLDEILENARSIGVGKIIVPGVTIKDIPRIIELIEKYDYLYGAVSQHPSDVKDWDENCYNKLKKYAQHPKIVAIGETGLDYYWDKTHIDLQKHVFKEHIKLAKELNLPLIIHNRDAHADTLEILKETQSEKVGGVMHCFSGSAEFAIECIKAGFYIALGGPVTFKNAKKPKEVAKAVPLEKLLLETDSPFLSPHPYRGERNDPSKIKLVAEEIAKIKEIPLEEVAYATTQNAKKLFNIK